MSAELNASDNLEKYEPPGMDNGRKLWFVWAGWLMVLLLVLALFAASLPHAMFDVKYYEWQVLQARPAAATIFPTYDAFVAYILLLRMAAVVVFWGTAVYIAWRKPKDWMVLYVSATLLMMSYLFAFQSDVDRWRFPDDLLTLFPAIEWIAPLLFATSFFLLFYLFPDGRFTPRWIGLVGLGSMGTSLIFFSNVGATIGLSEELAWFLFMLSILIFAFIGLASQVLKWRKATLVQKQQTRLVLLALIAFISLPFLQIIFDYFLSDNGWLHFLSLHLFLIGVTLIPLAIGVSVLRYRLWQMDVLLSRTLVYGGLTAVIVLLYVLVVGALGLLFRSRGNLLLAVLATGLIAVLFDPLKRRLQRSVNRLMYGQRDDPYAVMATLGKQLEQTVIPGETLPALVQTIAQTLKLPYVAIVDDANERLASVGMVQTMPQQTFPLVYQSQTIGQLVVSQRSVKEPFTADEAQLLRNVARQAGTAVYTARLTTDLQHARERLILAREEERRRLRRDLHDGLGPQLATLTMKISAAQNLLNSDPDNAANLLTEVKAESQNAIKEIRQVVEGLRPSALDQFGLISALQEFVAQNGNGRSHITLHAPASLPPLPAAVEVAAYRIAIEAMTNSLRHAQANTCTVNLRVNEQLTLEIRDDGVGLPTGYRPGVGLSSMRERAEELNGSFEIISDRNGTVITAVLPL